MESDVADADYISWSEHMEVVRAAREQYQLLLDRQLRKFISQYRAQVHKHEAVDSNRHCSPAVQQEVPLANSEVIEGNKGNSPLKTGKMPPQETILPLSVFRPVAADSAVQPAVSSSCRTTDDFSSSRMTDSALLSEVARLTEQLESIKAQCREASAAPVQLSFPPRRSSTQGVEKEKEDETARVPSRPSAFAQRKATLAAFRKASVSTAFRNSVSLDPKGSADKSVPQLAQGNSEAYFNMERRVKTLEELNLIVPSSPAEEAQLQRLRIAIANEARLFDETTELMKSIQEHDRHDLEQATLRQRIRLQTAEAQLNKLIGVELEKITLAQAASGERLETGNRDDVSDADSSDSDLISTGKDVELTKMQDGTVRISVGLQTLNQGLDIELDAVASALKEIDARDDKMKSSMDDMNNILRQLERCNEAFESEIFCSVCKQLSSDTYLLWPCGHPFCLECVYAKELPTGGYYCTECRTVTTDIPVANCSVNDLVARMNFKRSGVHDLFDVINRFRKEIGKADTAYRSAIAGLH